MKSPLADVKYKLLNITQDWKHPHGEHPSHWYWADNHPQFISRFYKEIIEKLGLTKEQKNRVKISFIKNSHLSPVFINKKTNNIALLISKYAHESYSIAGNLLKGKLKVIGHGTEHRFILAPTQVSYSLNLSKKVSFIYSGNLSFLYYSSHQKLIKLNTNCELHYDNILKLNEPYPKDDSTISMLWKEEYNDKNYYTEDFKYISIWVNRPYLNIRHALRKRGHGAIDLYKRIRKR